MIVNLCGPPGAGKSTLARQLMSRRAVQYLCIGDFRRAHSDGHAWQQLLRAADRAAGLVLLESSGIAKALVQWARTRRSSLRTVVVSASPAALRARLARRTVHEVWPYGSPIETLIDRCADELPRLWPGARWLHTDRLDVATAVARLEQLVCMGC